MAAKVYVINDPLAINFLVDNDIDGFKEYLESDEYLDFSEPEVLTPRLKLSLSVPVLVTALMNEPYPQLTLCVLLRKLIAHSLKPSKITKL